MKTIDCDCGFVVRGETDAVLVSNARAHVREAHPDMDGQVTDAQLLGMARTTV